MFDDVAKTEFKDKFPNFADNPYISGFSLYLRSFISMIGIFPDYVRAYSIYYYSIGSLILISLLIELFLSKFLSLFILDFYGKPLIVWLLDAA